MFLALGDSSHNILYLMRKRQPAVVCNVVILEELSD